MRGEPLNKELALTKLEPYLKLGVSLNRACNLFNDDNKYQEYIARSTVQTWYDQDDEVRQKMDAWRDYPTILARRGWLKKIEEGDYYACRDWLLKKEVDDEPKTPNTLTEFIINLHKSGDKEKGIPPTTISREFH